MAAASKDGGTISELYPNADELSQEIPSRAREFLSQAINSLHAPAGSVMLTASSVDAMLKEKNYKDGTLYERIRRAADDQVITKEMSDWAHEVRLDANAQRHADVLEDLPGPEDAQRCIEFARALAQFMFVLPARVTRGLAQAKSPQKTIENLL